MSSSDHKDKQQEDKQQGSPLKAVTDIGVVTGLKEAVDSYLNKPIAYIPDNMNSLEDYQKEVGKWTEYNFNRPEMGRIYDPIDPFFGVVEEVGELSHAILKGKQGIRVTPLQAQEMIDDAIGDALFYYMDYCYRNKKSINDIFKKVANKVFKRDWVKFPKNGLNE